MQLATGIIAPALGATGFGGTVRTPDANRTLAEARIRFHDKDDDVTFTSRQLLVAGGRLGAAEGYATLREALFELGVETRGDRLPAAVVLERDGRFYGHALKGRDLEQGFRAPLRRVHLEEDTQAAVVELRVANRFDRLRALVDGSWVHRFRA